MATKKKTEPKTDEKQVKEEVIEESVKVAEIEEKGSSAVDDFIARKLTAINKLNNPAKARRYAKWVFANKRGIR